ncbi:MAG: hypothetical protein JWM27_3793 [Gemmatimonadetes bacterium]|nr:hypothetical protein [Gemmatimonadota bacterium]
MGFGREVPPGLPPPGRTGPRSGPNALHGAGARGFVRPAAGALYFGFLPAAPGPRAAAARHRERTDEAD